MADPRLMFDDRRGPVGAAMGSAAMRSAAEKQADKDRGLRIAEMVGNSNLAYAKLDAAEKQEQQRIALQRQQMQMQDSLKNRGMNLDYAKAKSSSQLGVRRQQLAELANDQGSRQANAKLGLAGREQDYRESLPNQTDILDQRYQQNAADQIDSEAADVFAQLRSMDLNPDGKKVQGQLSGAYRALQAQKGKLSPNQYSDMMGQLMGGVERSRIGSYANEEPDPQSMFDQRTVQTPGGQVYYQGDDGKLTQLDIPDKAVGSEIGEMGENVMKPSDRIRSLMTDPSPAGQKSRKEARDNAIADIQLNHMPDESGAEYQPSGQEIAEHIQRNANRDYEMQMHGMGLDPTTGEPLPPPEPEPPKLEPIPASERSNNLAKVFQDVSSTESFSAANEAARNQGFEDGLAGMIDPHTADALSQIYPKDPMAAMASIVEKGISRESYFSLPPELQQRIQKDGMKVVTDTKQLKDIKPGSYYLIPDMTAWRRKETKEPKKAEVKQESVNQEIAPDPITEEKAEVKQQAMPADSQAGTSKQFAEPSPEQQKQRISELKKSPQQPAEEFSEITSQPRFNEANESAKKQGFMGGMSGMIDPFTSEMLKKINPKDPVGALSRMIEKGIPEDSYFSLPPEIQYRLQMNNIPIVTSQKELDALAPGADYMNADTVIRQKKKKEKAPPPVYGKYFNRR